MIAAQHAGRGQRAPLAAVGAILWVLASCSPTSNNDSLVDAVDPFIGTGGHGHTYPGATLPFGMMQLSPDTRLTGWDGCSGYHYSDNVVYGFSHTHLSGTGVSDYGDVLFMPVTGTAHLNNGAQQGPDQGYASRFDKEREAASPGYYSTVLTDYDITVDLTATERAGLHRYRFPQGQNASVVLDLVHRDPVLESSIAIHGEDEIVGMRRSSAWARDQVVYFVARFSKPFTARLARNDTFVPDATEIDGSHCKAVVDLGRDAGEVMIRIGISAVDIEGARRNLEAELPDFDFEAVHTAARRAWAQSLDRFTIQGDTPEQRTVFATALYHSFLAPNVFSDVDGRYRGLDGNVHQATDRRQYTVFSLWDTYRATHPLFTLVEPERTREFLHTFLAQYEQGGRLPVWELAGNETDCMIGYHSVSVIADAWNKGLTIDAGPQLLDAMLDSARRDHFGLDAYQQHGYIGIDHEAESVSKTLEYAYDDWCIARMAEALDKPQIADEFDRRAQAWRHLFDPQTRFMRPRENGGWHAPYDPRRVDFHHTEANGWQYRFAVPHDVSSLIEAMGGDAAFVAAIDSMFDIDSATTGRDQVDITGRIGQYAHGNEPSHHVAWLYHYAGRPDRSAARVDTIRRQFYTDQPDGLIGNEDCGQMSSWYVFAALGFYPVVPGNDQYVVVPPLFEEASIEVCAAQPFRIRRQGSGRYVQSLQLNGETLQRSWLTHADIIGGGDVVVTLAQQPGDWGQATEQRPHSRIPGAAIAAAAWIDAPAVSFRDSMQVHAGSGEPSVTYTWQSGSRQVQGPRFTVRETGPVVLTAHSPSGAVASEVTAYFWRVSHDWSIDISSTPRPQYSAGGPTALIDGRRGSSEWRTGAWHGYWGQDFDAVVDLGKPTTLNSAGAGFLQDMRSWILMPTEVIFEGSLDGTHYELLGRVTHSLPARRDDVFIEDLHTVFAATKVRYLRIHATHYGKLPDWHLGAGGDAYIFIDEIMVTEP